jgi:hypothetical protein
MVIYKTTNLINNKYYIGKDAKNNPKYLGSGKILKKAILKYGKKNFGKEIFCYCKSLIELNKKEIEYVTQEIVDDPNSYNLALGGPIGANLGKYKKKSVVKGIGFKQMFINKYGKDKGIIKYEKYRKNKSESVKGKKNGMFGSNKTKGEKNGMFGKKGKLCPSFGRIITDEQRKNYKNAQINKKTTEKTKKKMRLSHKNRDRGYVIQQIDNKGNILNKFKTIKEAIDILKISRKKAYANTFNNFKFIKLWEEKKEHGKIQMV